MTRRHLLILAWLVALALAATLPLSAVFHGVVHFGPGTYRAVGTQKQPVIAIGSDVDLPHGSQAVVVAVLGSIHVRGKVSDDLVAARGRIYLSPGARVDGDVLTLLGATYRARHTAVHGRLGGAVYSWDGRSAPPGSSMRSAIVNSIRLGLAGGLALLLVCTCLAIVFPWQIVLISSTLRSAPLKSILAGVLSLVTFVFLVVPLGLSLAGIPFALLLMAAAALAWLFGITSTAVVVGRVVSRRPVSLVWATAAGLVVLALAMAVPLFGPVFVTLAGLAGAGALAVALISRSKPALPVA